MSQVWMTVREAVAGQLYILYDSVRPRKGCLLYHNGCSTRLLTTIEMDVLCKQLNTMG